MSKNNVKQYLKVIAVVATVFISFMAHADEFNNLTLPSQEMQKLTQSFPLDDNVHITWHGDPIVIQLPIGKEKRLIFSDRVTINVKESLIKRGQLKILDNDKSLYITALKNFANTRIYVNLESSGRVIFIDLMTSETANNRTQYIDLEIEKNKMIDQPIKTAFMNEANDFNSSGDANLSYVDLIRFAWQAVYAFDGQVNQSFHRVPMQTKRFLANLVYGDKVIVHPVASWRAGGFYVTAVYLQNKYPHSVRINLHKDLCGSWLAASLYPRTLLKPHGQKLHDSSTLVLVSQKPFAETIGVCNGRA